MLNFLSNWILKYVYKYIFVFYASSKKIKGKSLQFEICKVTDISISPFTYYLLEILLIETIMTLNAFFYHIHVYKMMMWVW